LQITVFHLANSFLNFGVEVLYGIFHFSFSVFSSRIPVWILKNVIYLFFPYVLLFWFLLSCLCSQEVRWTCLNRLFWILCSLWSSPFL
jgi:hypothetical protein